MSRRSKLVYLWSFNAILASALVALGVVLLANDGSAGQVSACGADESADGERFTPANDSFDSITAAEDFICHQIAYPRLTPGWLIETISASRSGPAALVGRGLGFASVTLDYMLLNDSAADLRLEVSPFRIEPVTYGIIDHVQIMESSATVIQGLDKSHYVMQWEANGFSFYVEARVTDGFSLTQLYDILNSIR